MQTAASLRVIRRFSSCVVRRLDRRTHLTEVAVPSAGRSLRLRLDPPIKSADDENRDR